MKTLAGPANAYVGTSIFVIHKDVALPSPGLVTRQLKNNLINAVFFPGMDMGQPQAANSVALFANLKLAQDHLAVAVAGSAAYLMNDVEQKVQVKEINLRPETKVSLRTWTRKKGPVTPDPRDKPVISPFKLPKSERTRSTSRTTRR